MSKLSKKRKVIVIIMGIIAVWTLGLQSVLVAGALIAGEKLVIHLPSIVIGLISCGIFVIVKDWDFNNGKWRDSKE